MIIIRLSGGLGNQLFQYAFARSLSYNLNIELFLDLSMFTHSEKRKHVVFGLHSYNIKGIAGYYPYVESTSIGINYDKNQKLNKYNEGLPFPDAINEYQTIKNIPNLQLPVYIQGWFQNQIKDEKISYITENYFKMNNKLIHEDLKYSLPLSTEYKIISIGMRKFDAIALHIRHGDYKEYPKFGFCTVEYYQNAISLISKKVENPKFYIFTEDPEWVEENLNIHYPYQIIRFEEKNNSTGRGYAELLKLMSMCDHFIIANSTYSWWASFLGENPDKIIISPEPWFQDRSIIKTDTIDNVKTINLKNDYNLNFENSDKLLYKMNNQNIEFKNANVHYDNGLNLIKCKNDFKLFLKNIKLKNPDSKAIIRFSLESNCLNGLKLYYKTKDDKKYIDKNSLNLYYYKNENINHCLILPQEVELTEIMIKPYILNKSEKDYIKIKSIEIKELN